MKKLIGYVIAIFAYLWLKNKLKDKESNLSQYLKKMEGKFCCMIGDFMQGDKHSKKEEDADKSKE